jgi:hypothetical protein
LFLDTKQGGVTNARRPRLLTRSERECCKNLYEKVVITTMVSSNKIRSCILGIAYAEKPPCCHALANMDSAVVLLSCWPASSNHVMGIMFHHQTLQRTASSILTALLDASVRPRMDMSGMAA